MTECRPAYDLLIGTSTLLEKNMRYFSEVNVTLHCRPWLKQFVKISYPGMTVNKIITGMSCLFINSRVIMNDDLVNLFAQLDDTHDYLFTFKGELVAAYLGKELTEFMRESLEDNTPHTLDLIHYLRQKSITKELKSCHILQKSWDIISLNSDIIRNEFDVINLPGIIKGDINPYTSFYNEQNITIGKGSRVEDFVVIDARKGPVIIDENVDIQSGSRLEGPLYIGSGTTILGGRVSSSSIGPYCKIGGEVSNSVFLRYSNKGHHGFVGHSYVGEWVNLGAGSTTSNLKNTYGTVNLQQDGTTVDSQQLFLGTLFGDFVKAGINSSFNCGTTIGSFSMIFGQGMHRGSIPRFTWGDAGNYSKVTLEKGLEVAERMMKRRSRQLMDHHQSVITFLYKHD